jgi:hypothetical protein
MGVGSSWSSRITTSPPPPVFSRSIAILNGRVDLARVVGLCLHRHEDPWPAAVRRNEEAVPGTSVADLEHPKPRSFNFRQLSSVSRVAISPASMADTRYS